MLPCIFPAITKCSVWHGFDFKGDDFSNQLNVKSAADCYIYVNKILTVNFGVGSHMKAHVSKLKYSTHARK